MITLAEKRILLARLERYEGRVSHMYLDSNGYVTVGVGHLLSSVFAAQKLPFTDLSNKVATPSQIKLDYDAVKKQPFGNYSAAFYKRHTALTLSDRDINNLTEQHVYSFEKELKHMYKGFDLFPSEARLALFDMIFNLGANKLKIQYVKFNSAVNAEDWGRAAVESRRQRPVSALRNQYVKDLLNKAAKKIASSKKTSVPTP